MVRSYTRPVIVAVSARAAQVPHVEPPPRDSRILNAATRTQPECLASMQHAISGAAHLHTACGSQELSVSAGNDGFSISMFLMTSRRNITFGLTQLNVSRIGSSGRWTACVHR